MANVYNFGSICMRSKTMTLIDFDRTLTTMHLLLWPMIRLLCTEPSHPDNRPWPFFCKCSISLLWEKLERKDKYNVYDIYCLLYFHGTLCFCKWGISHCGRTQFGPKAAMKVRLYGCRYRLCKKERGFALMD